MKRIKIGKVFYKISFEAGPLLGDSDCRGYCDVDKKHIVILKNLKKLDKLRTLAHEVCHAFEEEYGVPIPHKLIYALEEPLADMLRHNYRVKRK
jgi:hypothetical protein